MPEQPLCIDYGRKLTFSGWPSEHGHVAPAWLVPLQCLLCTHHTLMKTFVDMSCASGGLLFLGKVHDKHSQPCQLVAHTCGSCWSHQLDVEIELHCLHTPLV